MPLFLRIILALTFLLSIISKLMSYTEFISFVAYITHLDETKSLYLVNTLTALEFYIALNLLINFNRLTFYLTLFLLIFFTTVNIYLVYENYTNNCYCFGNFLELSPINSLIKNIILTGLLFLTKKNIDQKNLVFTDFFLIFATIFTAQIVVNKPNNYFINIIVDPISIFEAKLNKHNITFIDARSKIQYQYSKIENSINLPYEQDNSYKFIQKVVDTINNISENSIIVTYCDSKVCSLSKNLAYGIKKKFPSRKVFYLEGGLDLW
jgi:rhodanese-related sulfurtransferase